jgi:hypothetical protein
MLILILGTGENHDLVTTCRELIADAEDFKVEVVSDLWAACNWLRDGKVVAIVCLSPDNRTIDFVNQAAHELTTAGSTLGTIVVVNTAFPDGTFSGLIEVVNTDEEEYDEVTDKVGSAMNYAKHRRPN